MRVTHRYWGAVLVGGFLAGFGVLLDYLLPVIGATVIGAWLLGWQYWFVQTLPQTLDDLTIDQRLEDERTVTDHDIPVTLSASVTNPTGLGLRIESTPPITADAGPANTRWIEFQVGAEQAATTYLASWPVAGSFTFASPTVTLIDPLGLFCATVAQGPTPSVTVAPRMPRNVHVGEGGDEIAMAYGEHAAGRHGSGLEPAELREYVPGDAAERIDWKATARLNEPYVREFDATTDRQTTLLIDHRASMGAGQPGETKLDYLRQVALAFVASARELDDPLGCYSIGDEGLTGRWRPEAEQNQYEQIRTHLNELSPTTNPSEKAGNGTLTSGEQQSGTQPPAVARRLAARLDGDETDFGTSLMPFFTASRTYIQRIEGDPLFETIQTAHRRLQGPVWTVIFTDDKQRVQLRETVQLARQGGNHVLLFVAPTVLFEPGGLADLESAYERYVDFEEFRREFARLSRVEAFEVAPGDRVDAVLAAGHNQRQRRQRNQ